MIVFDIDIPKLSKEGIDMKGSFTDIKELHCRSITG